MYIILRKIKNPVEAASPKHHNIDPAWIIVIDHFLVQFSIFFIIM